ncbi:balbiani ring protein 3-like [Harmonia axyridis]|uniref:balbiani ring protein 3-like n=1 Tax=Harmonia axyridis TaxID=115357 RepID=UPI001E275C7D|nr:balbiani ring protein 3-like [Harmonia axyridis]XP_045483162.1 balbiani ring protein 3-like [Harmonia axyridis]
MIIHWQLAFGVLLVLYISSAIGRKEAKSTSKCPMLTECPYRAQQCSEDNDCAVDSVCCKSPCGKVCTKQLFTGCETLKNAASRRAKSLGVDGKSVRAPRCNKSGGFEPIQCDNEIVSSCWCVDEAGFELAGTRAPAVGLVNCTAPKPCADHTCRMFCPHGFALDKDGCPLCRCRDPCTDIKCPNALECQLEDLACADPPCPPVPTCKKGRSLDSICPVGDPLRISETVRPFLCGNDPGKPTCPPMYQCLVQKGNDYGVCCPASLKIQKSGSCPSSDDNKTECGLPCSHDLECPSIQKCCNNDKCGSSCIHPKNVTECTHQRSLSEILSVSEREGRGYVPQCSPEGEFEPMQCSRNGLVCWCVDRLGRKIRGSMGPSDSVTCDVYDSSFDTKARSLDKMENNCQKLECAAICEYGFKLDENGCHTCKCDDPCDGYLCPEDEECINAKDATCSGFLCPTLPVCRPKAVYANPCERGTPLTDDMSGAPVACALRDEDGTVCPSNHECKAVVGSTQAVCCPMNYELEAEASEDINIPESRTQTMCEYLRDFTETMEGTREGMNLALPTPSCDEEGNFLPTQCDKKNCWCVDNFGTEIPKTRGKENATTDCTKLRETKECLDLTCRMGCEYGFILSEDTGCPLCQCRDPCYDVPCGSGEQCQLVEVNCKDHYCPPVPACLPKKLGQCPYLVPSNSISCDFACNSDLACNGTSKCCSNGCGTQCVEPLQYTACQHQRSLAQHQAHESGTPLNKVHIPSCNTDGSFNSKQCNPATGQCWCVDSNGFELSESRGSEDLDCDTTITPSRCPLRRCVENCEHGYKMDIEGCRTCQCADPCDEVKCRGEGETCRLVAVECVGSPCPAVPMCLPKKENPCQSGEPLRYGGEDEVVSCGPEEESCPSTHKCQLSPIGEYAVCCPKPRDICFEPLDQGTCQGVESRNLTRYYFNSRTNKCETFVFSGCHGNHNNFYTKELCSQVCPVLSQCERLREKNQKAAEKYNKPAFLPRCESSTGNWESVQCLEHVGVCWCVTPQGNPLKGTLTRGAEPDCNFRQARNRAQNRADFTSDADLVLEELMMQMGSISDIDEPSDLDRDESINEGLITSRCEELGGQCDANKKFLPQQCEEDICWCVDEAGNQLPQTSTFRRGERTCVFSPVEKVEVTLGFRGEYDDISSTPVVNRISKIVKNLGGVINDDGIAADISSDALYIRFSLIGSKKIDIAYTLEKMIMNQHLPDLTADITKSRVTHHLLTPSSSLRDTILALENREIVSQSPVSIVAPYHTALIVVAAASAFIISILTLLVILYRRKMNSISNNKVIEDNRFLSATRPIYIELPSEKYNTASSDSSKSSA